MSTPFPTIQALLFDLDGTLVDTDNMVVAQLARRLRPFFPTSAPRLARWLWMQAETPGNAAITLLDVLHLDKFFFALRERLRRQPIQYEFQLIPGVAEMLTAVAPHYPLALVTTRNRAHIEAFLGEFDTIPFVTTISAQDTRRLKPHPAPILLAAKRLGVPPANCLMVGDTRMDILAARRATAWAVGVLCGFGQRHELERAGAHHILAQTAELPNFLGLVSAP
jgi:HAD superfamily hydrolase (TIGR01509 family)